MVEDDAWDDIEGMVREDDGEVALVDENERTGKGVEAGSQNSVNIGVPLVMIWHLNSLIKQRLFDV